VYLAISYDFFKRSFESLLENESPQQRTAGVDAVCDCGNGRCVGLDVLPPNGCCKDADAAAALDEKSLERGSRG
jgi:hypothetical protein